MIEPLRARIDLFVWDIFRGRTLRDDHFVSDKGACLLGKAGRQIFYPQYEYFAKTMRRHLLREARLFVSIIKEGISDEFDDDSEEPFGEERNEVSLH